MSNAKRKCRYKQCGAYKPVETMIKVPLGYFCSPDCAFLYGSDKSMREAEKKQRADIRKRKESLKTKGDYKKTAQQAFNSYIRARDYDLPCISCGSRPLTRFGGSMDAGHYRSRGSAPHLCFDTRNCFAQCKKCNRDLSGNIVEYRRGLIARHGVKFVEAVESDQRPRHYSIDEFKRIAKIFRRRERHYKRLRLAA